MTSEQIISAYLAGTYGSSPCGPYPAPAEQYVPFDVLNPPSNCPPDAQYYEDVIDAFNARGVCIDGNGCCNAGTEPRTWNVACIQNNCDPGLSTGLLVALEALNTRCES